MKYFALMLSGLNYRPATDQDGNLLLWDSVLTAGEVAGEHALVFDLSKHEAAVALPVVDAGADVLVDGCWVRPAVLGSYV